VVVESPPIVHVKVESAKSEPVAWNEEGDVERSQLLAKVDEVRSDYLAEFEKDIVEEWEKEVLVPRALMEVQPHALSWPAVLASSTSEVNPHQGEPSRYVCPDCQKVFKTRQGLLGHRRHTHKNPKKRTPADQEGIPTQRNRSYFIINLLFLALFHHPGPSPTPSTVGGSPFRSPFIVNFLNGRFTSISVDPPEECAWSITMDGKRLLPTGPAPSFPVMLPERVVGDHMLEFITDGQLSQLMCRFSYGTHSQSLPRSQQAVRTNASLW
jgi:hypothetical protein